MYESGYDGIDTLFGTEFFVVCAPLGLFISVRYFVLYSTSDLVKRAVILLTIRETKSSIARQSPAHGVGELSTHYQGTNLVGQTASNRGGGS